jgi:hypothetical protein
VSDFKALQQQFAGWLRQPEQQPLPDGIEARRMAVYRRLVRTNIYSFLSAGFPVLKSLLPSVQWQQLVDDFVANHSAQSPYFSDMGREFVDFLAVYCAASNPLGAELPAYTYELASYERMEVDAQFAMINEIYQQVAVEHAGALVSQQRWWLNDSVQLAQFQHPVAWLGVDQNGEPLPLPVVNESGYLLMVYRPPQSSRAQFLQLEPLTAVLISHLQQQHEPQSLRALQQQLGQLLPHWDAGVVDSGVERLCIDFIQQGVLLRAP